MAGLPLPENAIPSSVAVCRVLTIEPKPLTPEIQQRNRSIVKAGFLNTDKRGASRIEAGVCGNAFSQLWQECGDPVGWTDADMVRPEIQDLVMGYRTFGRLAGGQPLIADEIAVLQKLLSRQQKLNEANSQTRSSKATLATVDQITKATEWIKAN